MKKILVAVDFSDASVNAVEYAFHFSANFKGAEITLYNAYPKDKNDDGGEGSVKYIKIARLREIGEKIIGKHKINMLYIAEAGTFVTNLEKYIAANNIDLVVAANKKNRIDKTDSSELNLTSLVHDLSIAVLIIPPAIKYK